MALHVAITGLILCLRHFISLPAPRAMDIMDDLIYTVNRPRRQRGPGHCLRRRAAHGRGSAERGCVRPKRHGRRSYGRAFLFLTASTGEYRPTHKDLSYPVLPLCDLVALGVLADCSAFRPPTSTLEAGTLLHQLVPLRVPAIEIGPPLSAPPGLHLAGLVNAANIHATHCLLVGDDTNAGIDEL